MNTKAAEGRARKAAVVEERKREAERKEEAEEDRKWQQGTYQSKKKEEDEAKRLEKLARKREREELDRKERAELDKFKGPKTSSTPSTGPSITTKERSIAVDALRAVAATTTTTTGRPSSSPTTSSSPIIIKTNSMPSQELAVETYTASNIDDALSLLGSLTVEPTTSTIERHPERRMKAAYAAFEEREMPILRSQNPGLRHSQLKERMFKMWQKSPENPFNQAHIAHTASREEEMQAIREQAEHELSRFRTSPTGSSSKGD